MNRHGHDIHTMIAVREKKTWCLLLFIEEWRVGITISWRNQFVTSPHLQIFNVFRYSVPNIHPNNTHLIRPCPKVPPWSINMLFGITVWHKHGVGPPLFRSTLWTIWWKASALFWRKYSGHHSLSGSTDAVVRIFFQTWTMWFLSLVNGRNVVDRVFLALPWRCHRI